MKNIKKIIFIILLFVPLFMFAQLEEPGDGEGGVGAGGGPVGGGAPIGSGLALILSLGIAYGAKKTFQLKSEEE
jgi:hypothetical protein